MRISLSDTGKRFNRDWVFRNCSFEFQSPDSYAITGANGSGKSTLLQVIAGSIAQSEGTVKYVVDEKNIEGDQLFHHISIAAPYLELIEEMTATELLYFHQRFKPLTGAMSIPAMLAVVGLERAAGKEIRFFSSGMKQRLKLAQAIFSETPCIFLDEPCTNLDEEGIGLYHRLVKEFCGNRLVIVSSNEKQEYGFCQHILRMNDYKINRNA